jgi:hypothetical protein
MKMILAFAALIGITSTMAAASVKNNNAFDIPSKTSSWLYSVMDKDGKFPGGVQSSPAPAYKGYLNCYNMNDMGETRGGISCTLLSAKNDDIYKGIQVPDRSAVWFFSTMEQAGNFEQGQGGPEAYQGYLDCSKVESVPGDGASNYPACDLAASENNL